MGSASLVYTLRTNPLIHLYTLFFSLQVPEPPLGQDGGRYAYLTSGWLFSEVVRGATNQRIDEYFKSNFISKFGLGTEMFYPVPYALVKVSEGVDKAVSQHVPENVQPQGVYGPDASSLSSVSLSPIPSLQKPRNGSHDASPTSHDVSESMLENRPTSGELKSGREAQTVPLQGALPSAADRKGGYTFELNLDQILRTQSLSRRSRKSVNGTETIPCYSEYRRLSATVSGSPLNDESNSNRQQQQLQKTGSGVNPSESLHSMFSTEGLSHSYQVRSPTFHPCATFGSQPMFHSPSSAQEDMEQPNSGRSSSCHLSPTGKPPVLQEMSAWLSAPPPSATPLGGSPKELHFASPCSPGELATVQTGRTPRKNIHRAGLLSKFTSSRREIGTARISNKEVMEKLNAAKRAAAKQIAAAHSTTGMMKYRSKYLHRLSGSSQDVDDSGRVSAIELAKSKPHVLDPLIYDSRRLHHLLIPPTNCRSTARALAKFYSHLASGKILSRPLIEKVGFS